VEPESLLVEAEAEDPVVVDLTVVLVKLLTLEVLQVQTTVKMDLMILDEVLEEVVEPLDQELLVETLVEAEAEVLVSP
tara:strand:- start:416 stop:649 length:234 start_codon:yes stop_codon:yes gene_type:complete